MQKNDDIIDDYVEELSGIMKDLSLQIDSIQNDLKRVSQSLSTLAGLKENIGSLDDIILANKKKRTTMVQHSDQQIIEGIFDGYFMIGDDTKKYPVPVNYASKSKLIPGDKLKVRIKDNGELVYKLIVPAERQHIRAVLSKDEKDTNKYIAIASNNTTYLLNSAAVSFYKGLPGDEAYITINKDGVGNYAALEAIIKSE